MQTPTPEDEALFTALLEGEDPGAYVVVPAGVLVSTLLIAFRTTVNSRGILQPQKAATRLILDLKRVGYLRRVT